MPVFISHRTADNATARRVYDFLSSRGVQCYIDELDPNVQPGNVTSVIMDRLHACTHLLAVVSDTTVQSWWVPFEIGAATEMKSRIATFRTTAAALPEYLSVWPILKQLADLEMYIQLYRSDRVVLLNKSMSREAQGAFVQSAADFHTKMKTYLGQR